MLQLYNYILGISTFYPRVHFSYTHMEQEKLSFSCGSPTDDGRKIEVREEMKFMIDYSTSNHRILERLKGLSI